MVEARPWVETCGLLDFLIFTRITIGDYEAKVCASGSKRDSVKDSDLEKSMNIRIHITRIAGCMG